MSVVLDKNDQELSNLLVVRDKDGRVAITIGLLVTVYFTNQLTRQVREAVADVADEYITLLGEHLRWAEPPMRNHYFPVHSKGVRRPNAWLPDHPDGESWHFEFHGGETADAASTAKVEGFGAPEYGTGNSMGFFHLTLPLLWFAQRPGSLLDYALNICNRLHPQSGWAGIGVLEPSNGYTANKFQATVAQFAGRFPGLEVENRVGHTLYLRTGIKGVNWLTIVGDHWLEELGGISYVGEQLTEGLTLTPYDGGAILQAGPKPEIGDVEASRWPQHYIAAAKLLKKVQVKQHRRLHFGGEGHMTAESSRAWLFRFDGK